MPKVIILGSSNAIPDENHENSHMALVGDERLVLIDCVNNPIVRLRKAGLDVENITDLILTHFHPDHVSGVPLLLMDLWLMGRKSELRIYGLDYTIERLETMMDLYGWDSSPNFFPVSMNRIAEKDMTVIQYHEEWQIYSSPVRHIIPNIGLRIEFEALERYSPILAILNPANRLSAWRTKPISWSTRSALPWDIQMRCKLDKLLKEWSAIFTDPLRKWQV